MKIVVAGASGYIGQGLIPRLLEAFPTATVYALSRSVTASENPRLVSTPCDLFSLKAIEEALPDQIDLAYYLVHSMVPTAHLDQGSFADYDLILADNFARSLRKRSVSRVLYLGGILPEGSERSLHLQSRREVEKVFLSHDLPAVVLRAGLVIGTGGSSFQMLNVLIDRLPVLVCPAWTQTRANPVSLSFMTESLVGLAKAPDAIGKVYDVANCVPITYLEMMKETAEAKGLKRRFLRVPFFSPSISRLWVQLITGASKNLVYPLVESLRHEMLARPSHAYRNGPLKTYRDLLEDVDFHAKVKKLPRSYHPMRNTVRSVQRIVLPEGKRADWVKDEYIQWLPKFLFPFVRVSKDQETVSFVLFIKRFKMLVLRSSTERSTVDRQILYIIKGFLVAEAERGRLEFREVLGRKFILAAIHDYRPALPWVVYRQTQARAHLFVMKAFSRHLSRVSREIGKPPPTNLHLPGAQ